MPSYKEAFPSKWLKAEDCNPSLVLTIKSVGFEDIGSGTEVKRKLVIRFYETEKGFVLNVTNGNLIAALLGTDNYDEWVGSRICLGSAKVQFKDKIVDAIRVQPIPVRKPRPSAAPSTPPAPAPSRAAAPAASRGPSAAPSRTPAPVPADEEEPEFVDEERPEAEVEF